MHQNGSLECLAQRSNVPAFRVLNLNLLFFSFVAKMKWCFHFSCHLCHTYNRATTLHKMCAVWKKCNSNHKTEFCYVFAILSIITSFASSWLNRPGTKRTEKEEEVKNQPSRNKLETWWVQVIDPKRYIIIKSAYALALNNKKV